MLLLLVPACLYIPASAVDERLADPRRDDTAPVDDTGTPPSTGAWYVDADGDGSGDPTSKSVDVQTAGYVQNAWDCDDADVTEPVWAAPDGMQSGVGTLADPLAAVGDAIKVASTCVRIRAGEYHEALTTGGKPLDIAGVDGTDATTLVGPGDGPVFTVQGAETDTLSGVTITGGTGLLASETDLYYEGGGIYVYGSKLTLNDVVLKGNTASTGGGIASGFSTLVLNNVRLEDNEAYYGAGMAITGGYVEAHGLQLVGNQGGFATAAGLTDTTAQLVDVLVNADRSTEGLDGILAQGTTLTLTNATFFDLDVALNVPDGTATLDNVIFHNVGTGVAGGASTVFTVSYSDSSGATFSGVEFTGTGNIAADPSFVAASANGDASDDDLTLVAGSPCIDAGDPALLDPDGTRSDMGAR